MNEKNKRRIINSRLLWYKIFQSQSKCVDLTGNINIISPIYLYVQVFNVAIINTNRKLYLSSL